MRHRGCWRFSRLSADFQQFSSSAVQQFSSSAGVEWDIDPERERERERVSSRTQTHSSIIPLPIVSSQLHDQTLSTSLSHTPTNYSFLELVL
jgi:hypothetical protein